MASSSSSIWQSPAPSEWVKGKLVGSGSFGTVHLAMNKSTGGLFVVKSARSSGGGSGCELLALENEVKILKSLRPSPYIVQCLGTDEDEGGNVKNVLMEYMAGGSLADVALKFGGRLDEEVVRVYTREILRGLQHVHEHGIVHCDLKCKNVLLGSAGNIKLADFGCAKRVSAATNKSDDDQIYVGGTPLWMAPEVLLMRRRKNNKNDADDDEIMVDVAADIWSLGCTVIEMATGRPPWAEELLISSSSNNNNPLAVMLKIAHGDGIPQFPSHFSREGLDFLSKCLQRDPKKRFTAQQLLSHPFVLSTTTTTTVVGVGPNTSPHQKDHHYYASSPTSVLDLQGFEDDEVEESSNPHDEVVGNHVRICCSSSSNLSSFDDDLLEQGILWQLGEEDDTTSAATALGSSGGNWITVRSSG